MKPPGMPMLLLSVAFGMLSQHALAQTNLLERVLVIEYHNSVLDHYYLSTPPEAAAIANAAGSTAVELRGVGISGRSADGRAMPQLLLLQTGVPAL
jgi:hypothetical protein